MITAASLVFSRFRLDGGAMFGAVPKPLWERQRPADAMNRISLVARGLLLRDGERTVLVDAGMGAKFSGREAELFQVEATPPSELPFRWSELTHIVATHLHFDHAGGLTVWKGGEGSSGREGGVPQAVLAAPAARIILQRANWELARSPGTRERASYVAENVAPLEGAALVLVDGEVEVLDGVMVHRSDGHTRGMQWVTVETGVGVLAFPADLVPTASHLHLPYCMGYDMCVETLLAEKEAFLRQAVEKDWIVVFAHDGETPAARVARDGKGRFTLGERVQL